MRAVWFAVLAGCSYSPQPAAPGTDGRPDMAVGSEVPTNCTGWNIPTSNFDPCLLPAAGTFSGTQIDTDAPGDLPAMEIAQQNGPAILVVHLSTLDVQGALTVLGSKPLVLAVEGNVVIGSGGSIGVAAGIDDPTFCANLLGVPGMASSDSNAGGGGGGGGAGVGNGAAGTNGDKGTAANGTQGTAGGSRTGVASLLVPLHGGCSGGDGGTSNGAGTPGTGGAGGGGLQISSNGSIDIAGKIDAAGRGGQGIPTARTGGGGGGGGGAIFLEASTVHLAGTLCADGGSGANGGGSSTGGEAGVVSPCDGDTAAPGADNGNNGGSGGDGGFRNSLNATSGGGAASGGGGGGGGGGAGWIRINGTLTKETAAVITPNP